jgi:hypothetical protein
LGRTGEARFRWPHQQARRAALSSAWSQSETVGSKVDGSYADHNNKITVAECARESACDPLGTAASG